MKQQLINCMRELARPLEPIPTETDAKLTPLGDVRAVLFDVYGTLFISGSGDVGTAMVAGRDAAAGEALSAAGFETLTPDAPSRAVTALFDCIARAHEARKAEGIVHPEVDIRTIWHDALTELAGAGCVRGVVSPETIARMAVEYECRVNPTWPMPHAVDVLAALRTKGVRLGIVSNAQFYTPLMFRALMDTAAGELGFEEALCAWSWETLEAKPSPDLFIPPLAELAADGLTPEQVVYVGNDMRNDIGPASRLGLRTVLFAGDARSLRLRDDDPTCAGLTPDATLTDLAQLQALIASV